MSVNNPNGARICRQLTVLWCVQDTEVHVVDPYVQRSEMW